MYFTSITRFLLYQRDCLIWQFCTSLTRLSRISLKEDGEEKK